VQQSRFEGTQRSSQLHNRTFGTLALRSLFEEHFFNIFKRLSLSLQLEQFALQFFPRCPFTIEPFC
jgi:hypothetical protein